jgi:hypothetical protein
MVSVSNPGRRFCGPELRESYRKLRASRKKFMTHHLRRFYLEKTARERMPDAVLVRNMTTVFNHLARWLRRQRLRPVIVLVLAGSGGLAQRIPGRTPACLDLPVRLFYSFAPL